MTELTVHTKRSLRVVIADDDASVLAALSSLIDDSDDLVLTGTVSSGEAAAQCAADTSADVVVVDVSMPTGGTDAVRRVRTLAPHACVVVFTANRSSRLRDALLDVGATAVLVKGEVSDLVGELVEAARSSQANQAI